MFGGVFAHDGAQVADALLYALGEPKGRRAEHGGLTAILPAGDDSGPALVAWLGTLGARGALDEVLGTQGQSEAALLLAAHLRYGPSAWLRLAGCFAAMVYDPEEETLHLVRSPGPLSPPIYFVREGRRTLYSTAWLPLAQRFGAPDRRRLEAWVQSGLWPEAEGTAVPEIEVVAPGTVFSVQAKGRNRRTRFWTFTPLSTPRRLPFADAQAELRTTLEACLREAGPIDALRLDAAEPVAQTLSALSGVRQAAERSTGSATELARRAAQLPGPLPKSVLTHIAALGPDQALLVDRGAPELFGATRGGLAALISSLARALEGSPRPGLVLQILRQGRPLAEALGEGGLAPELLATGWRVLDRWRGHLPAHLEDRWQDLGKNPPPPRTHGPVLTGDPFLDRRFAEISDRTLEVELLALRARSRRLVAPFADVRTLELLFQLPAEHLVADGQVFRLLGGSPPSTLRSGEAERADRAAGAELYEEGAAAWERSA